MDCFSWANKNQGIKQNYCKLCVKGFDEQAKLHPNYKQRKCQDRQKSVNQGRQVILETLKGKFCIDCGETDPIVLEFDHRGNKEYNVASMVSFSPQRMQKEIDKCDVRCANCHRKKTARDFGFYKTRV